MKKIRILTPARRDLVGGYRFYERQGEGIGRSFLDTLYSDIESLRVNAGIHPQSIAGYRRLLSKRFPYAVYYRIEKDEIRVYAVFDNRRNPEMIRKRLTAR